MAITEFEFKDHEDWLSIRHKYIGGSDAAATIGMNPYKSRYTLWAEKTDRIPEFEGNVTTKVGAYLEEFVAQMFEDTTGKKVRRKNRTLVNDLYPYASANLDRVVVGEKAFLEIKTTNSPVVLRQLKSKDFPEAYICQCYHYLAVTGYEKCYLAVLSECRNFQIYELERDEDEIKALMDAEKDFWHLVETNTEPAPDGTDSTSDSIKKMYPNAQDFSVDLAGYKDAAERVCCLNEQIKDLTALKDEQANLIKLFMKEAGNGILDGYSVSFKNQSRKAYDMEKLQKEHPEIDVESYRADSTSRVFRCTRKKAK